MPDWFLTRFIHKLRCCLPGSLSGKAHRPTSDQSIFARRILMETDKLLGTLRKISSLIIIPELFGLKGCEPKRSGKKVFLPFMVSLLFFVFSCSPNGSNSSEKKGNLLQEEDGLSAIYSHLRQKENIKSSASLVLSDSEPWRKKIKTKGDDIISALKNIYFEKKLDHVYAVGGKKLDEAPQAPLVIRLSSVNSKDSTALRLPYSNLKLIRSGGDLTLYRYSGRIKSFTIPKSNDMAKNIDWVNWKLIDALFPVKLHKNKKSFLTGNHSMEFIVDNRFSYFFVSKDAIFTESSKGTLLLLVYAQKSKELPSQSIDSCWVSLYIVDQQRKMKVLSMADINPDIEKQRLGSKGEWLLRAQIAQAPSRAQGIGFAIRSEISVQLDDFVLLAIQ
jgi:hypothetical protein